MARRLIFALLAIAVVFNIAGYALNLYTAFWWFDKALHAYTIFAITTLALFAYDAILIDAPRQPLLLALLIASVGLAIGALWEIAEWAFDQVVAGNVIQGKLDTITDLIVDTVGALAAGALVVYLLRQMKGR